MLDLELNMRAKARARTYRDDPWLKMAREDQRIPPGDWTTWLIQAGRGWGKTRTGSETVNCWATYSMELLGVPAHKLRIALVARTAADVRDTMVEGVSGLMSTARDWNKPFYEPSKRRIVWPNGAWATTFMAEQPEQLRGPEHHVAWADEAGTWERGEATWDNLILGLRGGIHPRVVVTTTPRRTKLIRRLSNMKNMVMTRGSTYDNAINLAGTFMDEVVGRYAGTRQGLQEIEGQLLEDREGAIWNIEMIADARVSKVPDLVRIVVGVDPSGGGKDSTGIVVVGRGVDDEYYVLEDATTRGTPQEWGSKAVQAYKKHKADRIIGEKNYGGQMVEYTIRAVNPDVSFKSVTASRGKAIRAEPIAAMYEQGKVHHVGHLRELEEEMTDWAPGDAESPDRMDALVWALTELSSRGRFMVS